MGSLVEINDTLQLTREQGFPETLQLDWHKAKPLRTEDFEGITLSFRNKKGIRCYQQPPVRCFLAENNGGDWIYWGHVFIQSITHDYIEKTTSGTYEIVRIFTPDEIEKAKNLIEFREEK